MQYTIIRKFYKSTKDMNPDNPYKVVDIWVYDGVTGGKPLTLEEAHIVCSKMMTDDLWINQVKMI